jgi:hypothetical protein
MPEFGDTKALDKKTRSSIAMGSATVPVAVFGVAPKTRPSKLNGSTNGSGATPEPAREPRALPPIVHPKMKTGKEFPSVSA